MSLTYQEVINNGFLDEQANAFRDSTNAEIISKIAKSLIV